MNNIPKLSIIVPIYNVEQFIERCVKSILDQTFMDFELILVNDGSKDNCPVICDNYAKKDSRIIVIHKKNEGLVSARKAGLGIANGDYIGYVDSDDWIDPRMFERMYAAAIEYGVDIVSCDFYISSIDGDIPCRLNTRTGYYSKLDLEKDLYLNILFDTKSNDFGITPSLCTKIFKKSIIEKYQYSVDNRIAMGEDLAVTLPCILNANSIYVLDNTYLYHYWQNPDSITRSYVKDYFERNVLLFDHLEKVIRGEYYNILKRQLDYFVVSKTSAAIINENKRDKADLKESKKYILKNIKNKTVKKSFKWDMLNNLIIRDKIYLILIKLHLFSYFYSLIYNRDQKVNCE
jgi:glycosyltransferase involved in cell wall biosynthesis